MKKNEKPGEFNEVLSLKARINFFCRVLFDLAAPKVITTVMPAPVYIRPNRFYNHSEPHESFCNNKIKN